MKDTTKSLKLEMEKDISKIYNHNNSKERKRTPEQNNQHRTDKANYYTNKWTYLLEHAETIAQKNYCKRVLSRIHLIR